MEWYIFSFAALSLICLISSKLSSRINMPSLLLFLMVGLIAGYHKNVAYNPQNVNLLGSLAMAFILFSGGFDTDWKIVRPVLKTGAILSSVGVLLTALFTGIISYGILSKFFPKIPFSGTLLLGAIVSSTDAAAVFSILRSKSVSLKGNLQPLLELESGSNDPMAAFLTIFMTELVKRELMSGVSAHWTTYLMIFPWFLLKMSVGIACGYLLGKFMVWLYNRIDFDYDGLYHVLSVVTILSAYSLTELVKGNGFMAVYVAGIVMGNSKFVFHNGVGRFNNGVSWFAQVVLFSTLGFVATPKSIWDSKWVGLCVAVSLMFIARPAAILLTMAGSKFSFRERLLVSWVGLRGGAPIMLATFPMLMLPKMSVRTYWTFHIVFFIVITSVLLQGMTIMPLAKLLKLNAPMKKNPRVPLSWEETGDKSSESRQLTVPIACDGKSIAELHLPAGALILLVRREEKFLVPRGDTVLQYDDILTVMGSPEALKQAEEQLA